MASRFINVGKPTIAWRLGAAISAALLGLSAAAWSAEPPLPAVDQATLLRASALFNAGRLVEAEVIFKAAVASMDSGAMPAGDLGRCVGPLVSIYRTWGRQEDALRMAERQREFLEKAAMNVTIRDQLLDENAIQRVDILAALERYDQAETLLKRLLDADQKQPGEIVRGLNLLVKSARLAELKGDAKIVRPRWQRVIEQGGQIMADMGRREIPRVKLPEIVAIVAAANVAIENFAAAIEAEQLLLANQTAAQDRAAALNTRAAIAILQAQNHEYATAQASLIALLADVRKKSSNSPEEADLLGRLGGVFEAEGLATEAKRQWRLAAGIYAGLLVKADREQSPAPVVMNLLAQLQMAQQQSGDYRAAIDTDRRLLKLREDRLGKNHPLAVAVRSDLGALLGASENYESAQPLLAEVLAYWRHHAPAAPTQLARAANDLGVVERAIGSFVSAQSLFDEALAIRERLLRSDDLRLAYSLNNAASVRLARGEYSAAVALFDRAIGIYRGRGRIAEDSLSGALLNVAMAYKSQGQYAKAGQYCREALKAYEHVFGADAPGAVAYYSALTTLAIADDRLDEAGQFNLHAWSLCTQHHLDRDLVAATVLHHRATIAYRRGNLDSAFDDWKAALEIQTAAGQTAGIARTLNYLAKTESLRGHAESAEKIYRQALERQRGIEAYPAMHYLTYCNLAEILHAEGKSAEASEMLQLAVKLVEAPRAGTIGAEEERAEYFSQFASAFDLLVTWSLQEGQTDRAFEVAERGRSRTFLDQLSLAGVDLRETLTGDAGKALLERERTTRERLGTLRGRMQAAASQSGTDLDRLTKEFAAAQDQFAAVWGEIRNASPFYRERLSRDAAIGSLAAARQSMQRSDGMLLFYYLGAKQSYLLLVGDEKTPVEIVPLEIPLVLADSLRIRAGHLTRDAAVSLVSQYLADLRDRAGGRGLSGIVTSPKGIIASEQGTQLAEVLVPRAVRKRIQDRRPRQITIVPDGALHQLPFESLLVEGGAKPRYLLDVLPPIAYSPSATILMNLESRPAAAASSVASVLTVGNPHYPQADVAPPAHLVAALSRDAYLDLGGRLPPLPGTSLECQRVAAAFAPKQVTLLEADDATEANVRRQIAGRRYVHLAAHGLVDQQHGNLFGAIALTPGPSAGETADNDGFLSLHEIHSLPLSSCELMVLSACQTNVGPDRPLEAGASLAQAFLAAGSRRVICSHWNVDDASTAELMGAFFEGVAKQQPADGAVNYAVLLQQARQKVRSNPRWASPYYWAPFVLVGPAE